MSKNNHKESFKDAKAYYDEFKKYITVKKSNGEIVDYIKEETLKESKGKLSYELEWEFIERMAKRMELNKSKYPPYNWKHNKIEVSKLKEALSRHFIEVQKGNYEDDGEYGHIVALACNAMMLIEQLKYENNK